MKGVQFGTTAVAASRTTLEHVGTLDANIAAQTTVGTLMSTPVNVNGNSSYASMAKLYGGVNVMSTPAAASRVVHTGEVDNSVPIVLDTHILVYGEPGGPGFKGVGAMTVVKTIVVPVPPVIIPPQTYYTLGLWGVAMDASAGAYRINAGWIEA